MPEIKKPDLIKSKGNCMTCGELFFYDVPHNVWDIETHCSQTCWDYYFLGEKSVGGVSYEDVEPEILETRSP
tara:strand:+ start:16159 stop:16374 length:216 start_codon:yes stop_codon:yes gene_type:complete